MTLFFKEDWLVGVLVFYSFFISEDLHWGRPTIFIRELCLLEVLPRHRYETHTGPNHGRSRGEKHAGVDQRVTEVALMALRSRPSKVGSVIVIARGTTVVRVVVMRVTALQELVHVACVEGTAS